MIMLKVLLLHLMVSFESAGYNINYRNHTIDQYENEQIGWALNQYPCVGIKIGVAALNKIFKKVGDQSVRKYNQ